MVALTAILVVALVFTLAYGAMQGGEERRTPASAAIAAVFAPSRGGVPKGAGRPKRLVRRAPEERLPWPFSRLDTLQQQAGEYEGPLRILLVIALASAGLALTAWLLTGQPLIVAGSALSGLAAPAALLRRKAAKRMAQVEEQVSGVCLRLSQALAAGATIDRALVEVAREAQAPLGDELRIVMRDVTVGSVPLEDALGRLPRRVPGAPSVRMLVASLQISIEMGADLGDQLERLADLIRQRRIAGARVGSVTAMARMQAKALSFVPLAAYVWMHFASPSTLAGYATPVGQFKLLALGAWVVLGYFVGQGLLADAFGGVL